MIDWTQVLSNLIGSLPTIIAAGGAVWLGWINSRKIDHNTTLTKAGSAAATGNARAAATAASIAVQKAEAIAQKTDALKDTVAEKLNGGLDDRIRTVVREEMMPFAAVYQAHVESDDKNMLEIRGALGELRDRLPKDPSRAP